jgi:hypothetical protein
MERLILAKQMVQMFVCKCRTTAKSQLFIAQQNLMVETAFTVKVKMH